MNSAIIIGAGAIGCLYGSKLSEAGLAVSLVSQSIATAAKDHIPQIQIDSPWGNQAFTPQHVYTNASEAAPTDIIIISAKTTDIPTLIADTALLVSEKTQAILLLQNGIHIETDWQTAFPETPLISGLAFVCCFRHSPLHIEHQDYGRIMIGDFPNGIGESTRTLASLWQSVGVPVITTERVQQARWKKLLWNAAFNSLSVCNGGQDTQALLATHEGETLARSIMQEVQALAKADGYTLSDEDIERNITDTRNMTPYKTSMLRDYENNRPLETEAILGNALRFARSKQIEVPQIEALYAQLALSQRFEQSEA